MLSKFSQIVNRLYAFIYETNHSNSGLGLPSIVALVMVIDKSWISLGKHEKAFYTGLKKFVDDCKPLVDSDGNIRCPCKSCRLVLWVSIKHLSDHISKYGFDSSYKTWIHHGEPDLPPPPLVIDNTRQPHMSDMTVCLNDLSYIPLNNEQNEPTQRDIGETSNNPTQAKRNEFEELYASANEKLHPGCDNVTRLDFMAKVRVDTCLCKRLLFVSGDDNKDVHLCPVCNTSRWNDSNIPGKKVPEKVLRYFLIIHRLQRLYKSSHTAKEITWHAAEKCTEPGKMQHPIDGRAWKDFDTNQSCSMWPVILTTYNMPPWLCMKESSFMLTLLIHCPKFPGKNIDVYLRSLIDGLKDLWAKLEVITKTIEYCFFDVVVEFHRSLLDFNGQIEDRDPPREFSRNAIMTQLARLPTRVKGKHPRFRGVKIKPNVLVELNWTKRSIFRSLSIEAIFGRPILPRWMCPFERYMKKLKNYNVTMKFNRPGRNVDCPPPTCQFQVFKSLCKSIALWTVIRIDHQALKNIRQRHVDNDPGVSKSSELFTLACEPSHTPISVNSCVVNGVRFTVHSRDKRHTTQNNDICSPCLNGEMYYGRLEQILEFSYLSFKTVLFRVKWFDTSNKGHMARRPLDWKVVKHVSHKKFLNGGVIVVEDDPDVIHVKNSSDLSLSTSLNDLEIAALHIDGQTIDVDAPPDIIDVVDEDDDIIDEEDLIPHDLADSNDEDLVNLDIDDGVNMSADVARGRDDNGGGDDRSPPYQIPTSCGGFLGTGTRKPILGGRRAGKMHTRQETRNLRLKAITNKNSPVPIQFEFGDRETLMPLGDHATHWANYPEELVRELPLHYPSWRQMSLERKAGLWQRL
nr:hypothetical protein [Tanacetum cinerariifolium]